MSARGSDTSGFSSICSLGLCRKRKGRLKPRAGACTDIGSVRETNDDLVFAGDDCRLYVALDGVGGHAGGAEASRIVLNELRSHVETMCESASGRADKDLMAAVAKALSDATKEMLLLADRKPAFEKMGTVFALAYIVDDTLLYTHVGDSRVYLIRNGQAQQLTNDETYVQLMVDVGVIQPDDIQDHPMRNIVLNAVGTQPADRNPIVHRKVLLPGDSVLLTTDGVSDELSGDVLAQIVAKHPEPKAAAARIVELAIQSGSRDNASCVAVMIDRAEGNTAHDDLHDELTKLHDVLSTMDTVDPELRTDMVRIAADIKRALRKEETHELATLRQRLSERALTFEVSHPILTNAIGGIVDLLAKMGI